MYIVGVVPFGIAVLGIVMLPKPKAPDCPVTEKFREAVAADWLVVRVILSA